MKWIYFGLLFIFGWVVAIYHPINTAPFWFITIPVMFYTVLKDIELKPYKK